jgi:large subunit ribosomal protein L19e
MAVKTVRRIAADLLKVGETRIWMDPDRLEDLESAVTRQDVRRLIKGGIITKTPSSAPSRGRKRALAMAKRRGRRRGAGSRKGAKGARTGWTSEWPARVRAMRRALRKLKKSGKVEGERYRKLYLQVKGGRFSSVRELLDQVTPARKTARRTKR